MKHHRFSLSGPGHFLTLFIPDGPDFGHGNVSSMRIAIGKEGLDILLLDREGRALGYGLLSPSAFSAGFEDNDVRLAFEKNWAIWSEATDGSSHEASELRDGESADIKAANMLNIRIRRHKGRLETSVTPRFASADGASHIGSVRIFVAGPGGLPPELRIGGA